ncbi:hypothetical protein Goari_025134 [Gossypium aridum]|uniref:Uncharacterized protein n=1 Tax=Gossypium aridum TaxID=34290 RepID=A0A7J8X9K7_GOSAI|nr:hypothetical protein [Gossypium aridum]
MKKEVDKQVEPKETYDGGDKKTSSSKDMLSALKGRVTKLEGSIGDVNETLKKVDGHITDLELWQDQLKEQVVKAFNVNVDTIKRVLNAVVGKLTEKNDALKAMVSSLQEQMEELKRELFIYKATLVNMVLAITPKPKINVLKLKEFNGTRFAMDVDYFVSTDEKRGGVTIRTWEEFLGEFNGSFTRNILRMRLRLNCVGLHNNAQLGIVGKARITTPRVYEITKAMTIAESLIEFVLRKDKFESSKPKEKGNGLHIVRDYLKQFMFLAIKGDDVPEKVPLKIGSILSFVKAKKVAKDVSCGGNIDLVDWSATKTPSKIYMKPIELLVEILPIRDVGYASDFGGKLVMQTGQLNKGSFRVLKRVSRGVYKLKLVAILKVSPMLNGRMPKPICKDQEDPDQGKLQ